MSRLRPHTGGRGGERFPGPGRFRVALLVAGLLLLLAPAAVVAAPDSTSCPFQVTPSESPSAGSGAAPLLVSFNVSVSTGVPTAYNWSFGDGGYYNGSSPAFAQAAHEYPLPGGYNATVTITESGCAESASLPVHVTAAPLNVHVTASASSGVAPLTVTFRGSVAGGTETYRSLDWGFGDGNEGSGPTVVYTFEAAGHFEVFLNVTDSSGAASSATTWVNVTAPPAAPDVNPSSPSGILPLALGAVGFVALLAILGYWFARGRPGSPRRPPPGGSAPIGSVPDGAFSEIPPPVSPPPGLPPTAPGAPAPDPTTIPAPTLARPPSIAPSTTAVSPESLRISQRVVLHLARQGALRPDEIAPNGLTQAGMAEELAVGQNSLTNVLRRLEAAGVVEADVRHVRGRPRRLKVYTLTSRGESIAKELRLRRSPRSTAS